MMMGQRGAWNPGSAMPDASPTGMPRRQHRSAAREGQPECGHLLAVPNQQDIAGQHRVIPGLAVDRREPRQLPLFRQNQQQVLIGQQNELAVAVASSLPLALAVLEVDAREDAAVEAEGIAIMNDEVVEEGLEKRKN